MKSDFSLDRHSTEFEALAFPYKLHVMLEDAKKFGFEKSIAWNSDGNGLQVHDVVHFTNRIGVIKTTQLHRNIGIPSIKTQRISIYNSSVS